jgi:hypothetical protein
MVPLSASLKRYRWLPAAEIAALVALLIGMGVARFSRLSTGEEAQVELEAGLEQVYRLEQDFHEEHGRFLDPADPGEGLEWPWIERYHWEFQASDSAFSGVVRADLDEDGEAGVWSIDQGTPRPRRLVPD